MQHNVEKALPIEVGGWGENIKLKGARLRTFLFGAVMEKSGG